MAACPHLGRLAKTDSQAHQQMSHPREAVDDDAPVVLDELLPESQLLLIALVDLNPVQRVHGLQAHRHLVLALQV